MIDVSTSPANGAVSVEGDRVTFTGTATDAEDGVWTDYVPWSSDLDGAPASR